MREIPQFPAGWNIARLRDVADYTMGRTPSRRVSEYWNSPEGTPWVSIGDMSPFETITKTAERISARAASEAFRGAPAPAGTLLMSFKLSLGRTCILGTDAYHNEAIIAIRPRPGIDRDFLRYYLPTINYREHQDRAIKGNTLNRAKLDNLPVPLPPIEEQRAIASVLSRLRGASTAQNCTVERLTELKAALMARLFRGRVGWKVQPLGELCRIQSGGTPSRAVQSYWNGTIPWVKTGEIDYGRIAATEEKITEEGLRNSSARIFPRGTVLIAMYGQGATRGKVARLAIDAATNQACAALIPTAELESGYLYFFCEHSYGRIRGLAHGGNQMNLNAEILRQVSISFPTNPAERADTVRILQAVDDRIENARARRRLAERRFESVLQILMTGQRRLGGQGG